MKNFYTYDADGRIHAAGICQDEDFAGQGGVGLFVAEGVANCFDNYLDGTTLMAKPQKPSAHHQFNYTTKTWEDPRTAASQWLIVRAERNQLLTASDWVVARAMELGQAVPTVWQTYRQALRDITTQADPFHIVWPTPPQN